MIRFFSLTLILFLVACAVPIPTQTPIPTPTLTSIPLPTKTPIPLPTPTETEPVMPENIKPMKVYNYTTGKTETLSPTFDKDMNTWVWKNTNGEVRRFLDLEIGHIFAQTASIGQYNQPENQRIIYQVDIDFGWEADLTNIDKIPKGYTATGLQYLVDIREHYSGIIVPGNPQTTITFKIVHGGYADIADKNRISQTSMKGDKRYEQPFLWPVYDKKNNTYVLATYMVSDYIAKQTKTEEIHWLTQYMLNYCPTSIFTPTNKPKIGVVADEIPKKLIQ